MKKSFFAFIVCILCAGIVSGQTFYPTMKEATGNKLQGGQGNRQVLECPPNTLYSHTVNYVDAFNSTVGQFTCYDRLESTPVSPINEITFFGAFFGNPGRNFTISFYHDNAGLPGTLFETSTSYIPGINTGVIWYSYTIYNYSCVLPTPVNLIAGDWVSILADGDYSSPWFWMTASGGDGCLYQVGGFGFYCDEGDLAFCLGSTAPLTVPVSNWALFIGIGLILVFAIVRFRKLV